MAQNEPILALGLMSGTSCDGVDAALVATDGRSRLSCGEAISLAYPAAFRQQLREAMRSREAPPAVVEELTRRHADAVTELLSRAGRRADEVRVLGFHGQTILHEPEKRRTWQIGDGALLAKLTGIDTVSDFRSADVAAGGQGAPFVPLYHQALAAKLARPLAVLNIGGVANVSFIGDDEDSLLAFDTGPGNALIDDWAFRHTGRPVDEDGRLASSGRVDRK